MGLRRRATADADIQAGVDAVSIKQLLEWQSLRDVPEVAAEINARVPVRRRVEDLQARRQAHGVSERGHIQLTARAKFAEEQRTLDEEMKAANQRVEAAIDVALARVRPPLVAEFRARLVPLEQALDALRRAAESVREIEELAGRFMTNGGNYAPSRVPLSSSLGSQIVARCEQFAFALRQHRSK